MTNTKTTKRALLASVLSIVICLTMLIGSTFAWFTNSATTGVNKIQSGTLDVGLEDEDGKSLEGEVLSFANKDGKTDILWEPGCTFLTQGFKVINKGNLEFKYKIVITGLNGDSMLLDVIKFSIVKEGEVEAALEGRSYTDMTGKWQITFDPETNKFVSTQIGSIGSDIMYVMAHMDESAGNIYQDKSLEGIGITVYATQDTVENDSFGDQYDKDATYADDAWDGSISNDYNAPATNETTTVTIKTAEELAAFANDVNVNGNEYDNATVELAADLDLMNIEWAPIGQTGATQFKGTFDGKGHTIYNLTVDSSDEEGDDYASGLFGWLEQGSPVIKNLTVDGATVTGHHDVAVIAGYAYGKIENCHVKNATIVNTHANAGACGDKTGLIVGYLGEDAKVINCTGSQSTITVDGRDAGQIVGAAMTACVTDCSATNVKVSFANKVTCDHSSIATGGNVNNAVIGRVLVN